MKNKCQGCKQEKEVRPVVITESSDKDTLRNLLLCSDCEDKHKRGLIRFNIVNEN